jgi:hypothetical protein
MKMTDREQVQILFYGNSAVEFHSAIESAFIQESCYELINNGLLLPAANGIYCDDSQMMRSTH